MAPKFALEVVRDPSPTVREAVLGLLRSFGIRHVFANPGSTELPLFRDFPDDFRYVLGLQEASVVGMADGFAQATRNASFVNLHSAAGVGNAMGNIFTAYKNRTPMIVTAGQQARSILPFDPFLSSAQATELPKPYVKWSVEPARAEDVPLAIARAYYLAMTPPCGPVLVSIPVDDWDKAAQPVTPRFVSSQIRPQASIVTAIGSALAASERPALVVGGAVDRDGGWDLAVALAERHNARVWVAPMSGRSSFPEDHPLFAGFLPALRERIVALLAGHDVLLALGAPIFTYHVAGDGPHVPDGASAFQLTDDPDAIAWAPVGTAAFCSVAAGLEDLLALPASAPRSRLMPVEHRAPPPAAPTVPMSAAFVLQVLARCRAPDDIVVEEAPSTRPEIQAHLPTTRAGTFYTMDSGGLGYGMPAAVGVSLGRPGARVIAVIGDGSSLYSIQAIWTAVQLDLPITFVILNNGCYAALEQFAPVFGFAQGDIVQGTALPGLDFVALAAGMGCPGERVVEPDRLHDTLRRAIDGRKPMLIEVAIA